MAKKINYASMFTLRSDGRYQGYWHELDADGQPKGKRHTICGRDPEKLYDRIQEKESPETHIMTFQNIAEDWQKKHWERIGYKTAEAYTAPLRRLIDKYGDEPAANVSAQSISAFLASLGKQGYSRRSVQMHRDILNMIFNEAIVSGSLPVNPCAAVSMPRNLKTKKREIPEDDAIAAVKASQDVSFGLFALICLYSGLRRGEALALQYEDIDRERRVIHVTKAIEFIGNNPHIKEPKTEAGRRDAVLLKKLADAIPDGNGLIFCRDDGKPLTKIQYRKRWAAYCKTIGYDITAHQLRHGFATILYEAGIPDKDAQELLGHSSITVTRDVYTHIRQSRRTETADALDNFID